MSTSTTTITDTNHDDDDNNNNNKMMIATTTTEHPTLQLKPPMMRDAVCVAGRGPNPAARACASRQAASYRCAPPGGFVQGRCRGIGGVGVGGDGGGGGGCCWSLVAPTAAAATPQTPPVVVMMVLAVVVSSNLEVSNSGSSRQSSRGVFCPVSLPLSALRHWRCAHAHAQTRTAIVGRSAV